MVKHTAKRGTNLPCIYLKHEHRPFMKDFRAHTRFRTLQGCPHTFVMKELDTGGIEERETSFTFTGGEVLLHIVETTLGNYTYDLKGAQG